MPGRVNVASLTGLPGPVDQLCARFKDAGWSEEAWPDFGGWVPGDVLTDVTGGAVLGRIGMRDQFGELLTAKTERSAPYTKQHINKEIREVSLFDRCEWSVMSVPMIDSDTLESIVDEAATAKARRQRKR